MTNREFNSTVKEELKDKGYNVKDFKVSVKNCGYSTSINVKIKNPHVKRSDVEKVLNQFRIVDRDERNGEILEGGNTYLFVAYEYNIFEEVKLEWVATATGAIREPGEVTKIFDGLYLLNKSGRMEIKQQNDIYWGSRVISGVGDLAEYIYKFAEFKSIAA